MPYIEEQDRDNLWMDTSTTAGELNYFITEMVDTFIREKGLSYASINEAIGALECAKLELYRRVAVPYEDHKKDINGDVYSPSNIKTDAQ